VTLSIGARLGSHEILEPLGRGGMGEVYRARDSKLKRGVAIKILPAAFSEDEERVSRFQREAQILASLRHPKTIRRMKGLPLTMAPLCDPQPSGSAPQAQSYIAKEWCAAADVSMMSHAAVMASVPTGERRARRVFMLALRYSNPNRTGRAGMTHVAVGLDQRTTAAVKQRSADRRRYKSVRTAGAGQLERIRDQRVSGGVLAGGRRGFATCSKANANAMSAGSLHSGPSNSMPTGTPSGADPVGLEKPPGNVIAGNPVLFDRTPFRST